MKYLLSFVSLFLICSNLFGQINNPVVDEKSVMFYSMDQTPEIGLYKIDDVTENTEGSLDRTTNGIPQLTTGASAYSGNAWDFSLNESHIRTVSNDITNSLGDITSTKGLTIGFWINELYESNPNFRVAGIGDSIDVQISAWSGVGTIRFNYGSSLNVSTRNIDNVLDGTWHHLVATIDFESSTDNFKLYMDGAEITSQTKSANITTSKNGIGRPFIIGARANSGHPFSGTLDEFIVFDRAISASEVNILQQYGGEIFSRRDIVNIGNDTIISAGTTSLNFTPTVKTTEFLNPAGPFTYSWLQVSGPTAVNFTPNNTANTTVSFPALGTYVLQLSVSDGLHTITDQVTIEVLSNIAPVLDIGTSLYLPSPNNTIALTPVAMDIDNYPTALQTTWSQIGGTATATFDNAASANTNVNLSGEGRYLLELSITDGDVTLKDSMEIVISPSSSVGGFYYRWDDYDHAEAFGTVNPAFVMDDLVTVSHIPEVGVHPRIFFGPDDIPEIKNRMNNTASGQEAMKQIHAYTTLLHLGYGTLGGTPYSHNASYGRDDQGNTRIDNAGKWDSAVIYEKLVNEDPTALDGVDIKRKTLLAGIIPLVAYECMIREGEMNTDVGRSYDDIALDLATAMAYWATLVKDDAGVNEYNYNAFGGEHMALAYDLNYNVMTTTQRDLVRAGLAQIIIDMPRYGVNVEPHATTSNWVGLNTFEIITNWAIEGEEGYQEDLAHHYMRTYRNFLNYGWYEDGTPYEGLGKNYQFVIMMVAAARRGYSLLGHPTVRAYGTDFLTAITQPYGGCFVGTDAWGGTGDGIEKGGYKFNSADIVGLKWMYPNDPKIDFAWQNYINEWHGNPGSEDYVYQQIAPAASGYHNYLLIASIFAKDYQTGDFETQNTVALDNKLSFFGKERGLLTTRSGFGPDAMMSHIHCRQDMGGHTYGDKNNFTLSALGRMWVRYSFRGNVLETQFHSGILVDDLGVPNFNGGIARQPAKILRYEDTPEFTQIMGDATYAYSWEWQWSGGPASNDHPLLGTNGWEKVMETRNDFRYEAGTEPHFDIPFYEYAEWNGPYQERIIKRPYNMMEKVYRNTALVRSSRPFLLVMDEIKKDDNVHNYKWLAQIANDLTITSTDVNLVDSDYRCDVILSEPTGNRKLLVRVLENQGYNGVGAPMYTDVIQNSSVDFTRLVMEADVVSPDFKVMLFPYVDGEILPKTTWNTSHDTLLVDLGNGEIKKVVFIETAHDDHRTFIRVHDGADGLPVELMDFSGRNLNASRNQLNWVAASELDFSHYELQRSSTGSDFIPITQITGKGNTAEISQYEYIDNDFKTAKNYYRLKMIDLDGSFEYSNTIVLEAERNKKIDVYPNPVNDVIQIQLDFEIEGDIDYTLVTIDGQKLKTGIINNRNYEVDINHLENGVYILYLDGKGISETIKIIKE